jgi:signal peptidase I
VTRKPALGCALEIVETLVLTLLIFWVIQSFVAQPYRVQQESMEQTLEPEQYVLVDKLTPRWDTYKRGDIVVFDPPETWVRTDPPQPYIKRVIGVGGDTIEFRDGAVYLNTVKLDEPYVYQVDGQPQPTDPSTGPNLVVVPPGELFLMGDHRADSSDSRAGGTVPTSAIIGRAFLRYWPIDTFRILPTPSHPELATPDQ